MSDKDQVVYRMENTIQPISDDYYSDGTLDDYARVDHQHPLSATLKGKIGGYGSPSLLHNGQMSVKQRAINSVVVVSNYMADRWRADNNAVGTQTLQYATKGAFGILVPSGRPQPANYQYFQTTVIDAALAAADYLVYSQMIEGLSLQHLDWGTPTAKSLTLSFDVYSTVTNTYVCELINTSVGRYLGKTFTVTGGKFQTITLTYAGDTGSTFPNTAASALQVQFVLAAGSAFTGGAAISPTWSGVSNTRMVGLQNNHPATVNNVFCVTNVQLDVGTSSTPFEIRHYGEELLRCQRYYEETGIILNTVIPPHYSGYWKVTKRITPNVTITLQGGVGGTVTPFSAGFGDLQGFYQNAANSVPSNSLITGSAEF